jgi:LmbE family N-acetylglucosaminyl deacetylase
MIDRIVIAPHADDEVIGAAASLGPDTLVFYVGVDDFHVVSKHDRYLEVLASAEIGKYLVRLPYIAVEGRPSWVSFHHGDYKVNYYYDKFKQLISEFESLFEEERPREVLLPWPSYNQDHQTAYHAALVALRPHDTNHFVKNVLLYEEPDCWWPNNSLEQFRPSLYRELDLEHKLNMYRAMPSQIRGHRSTDHLAALAKIRGAEANLDFAEAYQILRWVE